MLNFFLKKKQIKEESVVQQSSRGLSLAWNFSFEVPTYLPIGYSSETNSPDNPDILVSSLNFYNPHHYMISCNRSCDRTCVPVFASHLSSTIFSLIHSFNVSSSSPFFFLIYFIFLLLIRCNVEIWDRHNHQTETLVIKSVARWINSVIY